jgi:hypothetical protein
MRQGHDTGGVIAPRAHSFPQSRLRRGAKMIPLRVGAYQEGQTDFLQQRQQTRAPQGSALAPWRRVGAIYGSWVTKPYRRNRNVSFVIKRLAIELHPLSQPITRRVIPGHTRNMNASPRRLARDQDFRLGIHPYDGTMLMRQRTCAARLDLSDEVLQGLGHRANLGCPAPAPKAGAQNALDKLARRW